MDVNPPLSIDVFLPDVASKTSAARGSAVMSFRGVILFGVSRNFESISARITHLIYCHGSDNEGSGPHGSSFRVLLFKMIADASGAKKWAKPA